MQTFASEKKLFPRLNPLLQTDDPLQQKLFPFRIEDRRNRNQQCLSLYYRGDTEARFVAVKTP